MTLSYPQLIWLADSKYGKNRMKFLVSMLRMTALSSYESVVNNIPATVNVGQVERSEVQLAKDWGCDRKTVARVIQTMNKLGIITTEKSNRTSVHNIHVVAAWVVDNVKIRNPYFKTDYDWRNLRQGNLADAVTGVTFGQPQKQNARNSKDNISSGELPDMGGKPVVQPTVLGLEALESLTGESVSTDDEVEVSDGEAQVSANTEPESMSQREIE